VKRKLSAAQVVKQVTFLLKGHLKNAQFSYLRAAALLARVRDENISRAPKYADIHLTVCR
jgi:hypothetical protein